MYIIYSVECISFTEADDSLLLTLAGHSPDEQMLPTINQNSRFRFLSYPIIWSKKTVCPDGSRSLKGLEGKEGSEGSGCHKVWRCGEGLSRPNRLASDFKRQALRSLDRCWPETVWGQIENAKIKPFSRMATVLNPSKKAFLSYMYIYVPDIQWMFSWIPNPSPDNPDDEKVLPTPASADYSRVSCHLAGAPLSVCAGGD